MCHVLFFEPKEESVQWVCWLHDQASAYEFAKKVSDKTGVQIQVTRLPIAQARELHIKYWEEVAHVFLNQPM